MEKEFEGLKNSPKAKTNRDLQGTTKKKIYISNRKKLGHDGIHRFWFKKFTSILDRLALEMNRCTQGTHVPEWMTEGKTTLIKKTQSPPQQIQTYKLPSYVVEKTNGTEKGTYVYSQTSHELLPEEQKGCRKGSRSITELIHIDQHILNENKAINCQKCTKYQMKA